MLYSWSPYDCHPHQLPRYETMRTLITLFITLLCVAPGALAGPDPAEPIGVVCAFCEDLRALQLFYGTDVSLETPFLITLEMKCNSECSPEEKIGPPALRRRDAKRFVALIPVGNQGISPDATPAQARLPQVRRSRGSGCEARNRPRHIPS